MKTLIFFVMSINTFMCNTAGVRLTQIANRLNVLEDKLFFNSKEFRQDIQRIFEMLNNTFSQNIDESAVASGMNYLETAVYDNLKVSVRQDTEAVKKGFAEEKLRLREYVKIIELSLKRIEKGVADELSLTESFKDLKSELARVCQQRDEELRNFHDRLNASEENNKEMIQSISRVQNFFENLSKEIKTFSSLQTQHQSEIRQSLSYQCDKVRNLAVAMSDKWEHFGNSYYYISSEMKTWEQANAWCHAIGTDLVEVNSEAEQDFLDEILKKVEHNNKHYIYLGASDLQEEGNWKWTKSDNNLTLSFWHTNEPNGGRRENCLHMYRVHNRRWNDVPCDRKYWFICEAYFEYL